MSSKSTRKRQRFACLDCGRDTGKLKEFYYINLDLWLSVVDSKNGMLCIKDLERRLGRELKACDFSNASINYTGDKSDLLRKRLTNVA